MQKRRENPTASHAFNQSMIPATYFATQFRVSVGFCTAVKWPISCFGARGRVLTIKLNVVSWKHGRMYMVNHGSLSPLGTG